MADGVFLLSGTHNMLTLNDIRSYMSAFHIPFVTTGQPVNITGQEYQYVTYMQPYLADAIVDVMELYNWEKVHYLYENHDGENHCRFNIKPNCRNGYHIEIVPSMRMIKHGQPWLRG